MLLILDQICSPFSSLTLNSKSCKVCVFVCKKRPLSALSKNCCFVLFCKESFLWDVQLYVITFLKVTTKDFWVWWFLKFQTNFKKVWRNGVYSEQCSSLSCWLSVKIWVLVSSHDQLKFKSRVVSGKSTDDVMIFQPRGSRGEAHHAAKSLRWSVK